MEPWNLIPQSIEPLIELFRRPSGYYEPLLSLPVNIGQAGASFSGGFRHRYRGPHRVSLRMEEKIPHPVASFDWGGRFRLSLEADGYARIVQDVGESPRLWMPDAETNGFSCLEYLVPYDLPFRGEIRIELQVLDAGRGPPAEYGAASLDVRRRSYYLYRRPRPSRT